MSTLSGGDQRQSMHVISNTRIHQQITNIVYSEPSIGVNENFNILEYWHLKRDDPNWKEFTIFLKLFLVLNFLRSKLNEILVALQWSAPI